MRNKETRFSYKCEIGNVVYVYNSGVILNTSNGKTTQSTLRDFRNMANGARITRNRNLRLGEYVNINTGEIESLFGIE